MKRTSNNLSTAAANKVEPNAFYGIYVLKAKSLAAYDNGLNRGTLYVPVDAVLFVRKIPDTRASQLVEILWEGRHLKMFLQDLNDRALFQGVSSLRFLPNASKE